MERTYLRLLESSVFVSDYVDKVTAARVTVFRYLFLLLLLPLDDEQVDTARLAKGSKRTFAQLREICSILSGILFKKRYEVND